MSENVYNVVQLGRQAGTFDAPGAAVAASILYPVEDVVNFDMDRGSAISKQDRGRNVRNSAGAGYHGVRLATTSLPSQCRFGDAMHMLEMIYAGGVVPSSLGGGLYAWLYPFEAGAPTVIPYTMEQGNVDSVYSQQRLISALIGQLQLSFSALSAPGASPWMFAADVIGLNRDFAALTSTGAAVNEVQTVTISNADGGTFTLSFGGSTTAPLAFSASTAAVQTALRGLASINGANVNVGGVAGAYTVTFVGSLAGQNVSALTANAAGLTNSAAPPDPSIAVVTSTPGSGATLVAASADLEVMQGHLTRLYEGTTGTGFGALAELAGSLKSYSQTAQRSLVGRAYGSASDVATKFGFTEQSNATFEAMIGVSATSKSDFHDIWNVASPASLGERRWRLQCSGSGGKKMTIDLRAAILAVPFDDADGERLFSVSGEMVDDDALDASHSIEIVNGIAGPL